MHTGLTGGAITLNHNNGHYQTITTDASVTLTFTNFPASGSLGRIILDITCANVAHTLDYSKCCYSCRQRDRR